MVGKKMDWIKVTDRKPAQYITVYVLKPDGFMAKAMYNEMKKIWTWHRKEVPVTHWKYIPQKN